MNKLYDFADRTLLMMCLTPFHDTDWMSFCRLTAHEREWLTVTDNLEYALDFEVNYPFRPVVGRQIRPPRVVFGGIFQKISPRVVFGGTAKKGGGTVGVQEKMGGVLGVKSTKIGYFSHFLGKFR